MTGVSTWDASAEYNDGDIVVENGVTYVADWWTKGERPGTTGKWGVWKVISGEPGPAVEPPPPTTTPPPVVAPPPPTTTPPPVVGDSNWDASKTYVKNDIVIYNGVTYISGWWHKGKEPGTTGEWGVWKEFKEDK
ncbi:carbohydrate-binding protein [Psychromonas ossibalaenae]|uniref:carbohydrate-binding protein n=1 Tax=Psychromonas ossibalaenae TaxID=444922 RepID=UPI0003605180|nr:carbohydrate-binding protein [Psychromonas ossibalaenae]